MKYILHTFVFCSICIISEVQAQIQITKDSLSVTKLVAFEEMVNFENYQVK